MKYSLTHFNHVSCLQSLECRRRMACAVQHAGTHSRAATTCAVNGQPPQLQVTPDSRSLLPIRVSQRIAGARAAESRRRSEKGDNCDPPLFLDPYAELLAGWQQSQQQQQQQKAPGIAAVQKEGDAAVRGAAMDVIATAHVDRLLLNAAAVSAVNRITQGDYRQVVLLGDAMDTRPFRLPLAPGTAIFMVAPEAAHAAAAAALASKDAIAIADAISASVSEPTATNRGDSAAAEDNDVGGSAAAAGVVAAAAGGDSEGRGVALGRDRRPSGPVSGRFRSQLRGPRPPPGCLLRRVSLEFQAGADFSALPDALAAAGFRADRLSIWAVQGLEGLELSYRDVMSLLAEAAHCAAYHSLVLGELPAMSYNQAANALAEVGLLGAPLAFGTPHSSYGRWQPEWGDGDGDGDGGESSSFSAEAAVGEVASEGGPRRADAPQRWLFAAQQIRLSVAQMDTYVAHRAAAEEADEDFFDNFS